MSHMTYQGTVLGPMLWNLFFRDAQNAIAMCNFENIVYADDLNAYCLIPNSISEDECFQKLDEVQGHLHAWGDAQGIKFDAGKESKHLISHHLPVGDSFRILGILFDCKLIMDRCIHETVTSCNFKIKMLLRVKRFYSLFELINLYKAHILSFIEYRSPALLHASNTVLMPLDLVQTRFLTQLDVSIEAGAVYFSLLPLRTRRQIAAL
eukprot:4177217-Karenia_brevis.AAC.1